jgi:hypothetical protein
MGSLFLVGFLGSPAGAPLESGGTWKEESAEGGRNIGGAGKERGQSLGCATGQGEQSA